MRIIFLTTALLPECGGPFESVAGLARGLASCPGIAVSVLGCTPGGSGWSRHAAHWGAAGLSVHEGPLLRRITAACNYLESRLMDQTVDVIHAGGLWDETALLMSRVAVRWDVPIVWSPRGMLEPWALRRHAIRKRCAWIAGQRAAMQAAAVIHATAWPEATSCRAAGLRQPIAVIPNGITTAPLASSAAPRGYAARRRCGYLGRLHPHKGLANLIEAWASCDTTGWELAIAGPDCDGHTSMLLSLIDRKRLNNVAIRGPQYGADRGAFLEGCDLFVCPSLSENFGIAIAEAMERGVPVVTTTGTPWRVLSDRALGWWVEPEPVALAAALSAAIRTPPAKLQQMGRGAREYVRETFSWPIVVAHMKSVYEWMCTSRTNPDCLTFFDAVSGGRETTADSILHAID